MHALAWFLVCEALLRREPAPPCFIPLFTHSISFSDATDVGMPRFFFNLNWFLHACLLGAVIACGCAHI